MRVLKSHCKYGHEFTPENTYWRREGRECRQCARERYERNSAGLYKTRRPIGPRQPKKQRQKRLTGQDLFWSKVDQNGPVSTHRPELGRCWVWQAGRFDNGYGAFGVNRVNRGAHRVAYEWLVGPIPAGMTLDHLCRVRHCVNPAHLEPVSRGENVLRGEGRSAENARKTHCKRGHPLSGDNVRLSGGGRTCRTCVYENYLRRSAANTRGRYKHQTYL